MRKRKPLTTSAPVRPNQLRKVGQNDEDHAENRDGNAGGKIVVAEEPVAEGGDVEQERAVHEWGGCTPGRRKTGRNIARRLSSWLTTRSPRFQKG